MWLVRSVAGKSETLWRVPKEVPARFSCRFCLHARVASDCVASDSLDLLQSGLVTDADIDAIIAKGEKETADLNNKLQEYTENAMKFTMDGGTRPHLDVSECL